MEKMKKARKCLSVLERLKLVDEIKQDKPVMEVARGFGVSKAQAYKVFKSKDKLKKLAHTGLVPLKSKIVVNKSKHKEIDEAVFGWFRSFRTFNGTRKPLPVSRELIRAKAMYEAKKRGVAGFVASNGWISRWRWRHRVSRCTRLVGEAGEVDINTADEEVEILRSSMSMYNPNNVFNMDELGLFYKAIPQYSYLLESEGDKRQHGRGTKRMKAKDRLTVILCANATGTVKISPVVVGSAKKPRCFKKERPCLPYFSQSSAWCDKTIFSRWWHEVFLPEVQKLTPEPIALILDGFSGHDEGCADPLQQVKIFKLPPNVTSIYQPLDQGLIAALKVRYKSSLLARLVETDEDISRLQSLAQQLPAGSAGLKYGAPPHVGDALVLLKDAWDNISSLTIAACWRHSRCLSLVQLNDAASSNEHIKIDALNDMCNQLCSLKLSSELLASMGLHTHKTDLKNYCMSMLAKWMHVEESEGIDVSEKEEVEEDESELQAEDKVSLLTNALKQVNGLHLVGVKLNDTKMMETARQLCLYVHDCI